MFKSKMLATMTLVFAIAAMLSTLSIARTAYAEGASDVFMDEGDGDFDSMPAPPAATAPVAEAPPKVEAPPKAEPVAPKVAEPRPAIKPEPEADNITMLTDDAAQPSATPAPTEDPAQPKEAKPKKEKKSKKKKATASTEDTSVKAAGQFVTTKEPCPMMRSPASTGETMLTVKASKKIWVEDAGDGWVKAFNKAGEPGYVSKECVQ
jgi:outer membrane biosynthesis protein TonB